MAAQGREPLVVCLLSACHLGLAKGAWNCITQCR
jgi:hypothetical protein